MRVAPFSPAESPIPASRRPAPELARQLLADAATAWRLPSLWVLLLIIAPFVVALFGAVAALLGKDVYKWVTQEDGLAETLQVLFYIVTLVMSLIYTGRQWRSGERLVAGLYLVFSLGLCFLIGEELSWGQRIFGWETPATLQEINKQEEMNLHNIYGVGDTFKWIQMLVGAYGTFLPLLMLRWKGTGRLHQIVSAIVPHVSLVPYFFLFFLWRLYRNLMPEPEQYYFVIAEYNEVLELTLAIGLTLFILFRLRNSQPRTSLQR